jgi:xylan 1,4-beta-xylosidase
MRFLLTFFIVLLTSTGFSQQITIQNPILSGYYPDPSIVKVGSDYYLINSTFSHYPGLPISHSKDLKNWKHIGYVITDPKQMNFMGETVSRGLFAPSISYHDGLFYVTCTDIDNDGNFVVTATNPAGPWSAPVKIPEVRGIDPSIYFEGEKAYIVYNSDAPDNKPLYSGHRTLRMYEFDYKNLKVVGEEVLLVNGGVDLSTKPVWIEGPHIYKRNDYYYLCAAEGGTSVDHSQVILRSKNVKGPYIPYENNPILTQRHLEPNRKKPITSTGHADLVEGPDGNTYAVFLAVRPYEGDYYNTGRETFIAPVKWTEDGWPIINPDFEEVQYQYTFNWKEVPQKKALPQSGSFGYRLDFKNGIDPSLLFLRTYDPSWFKTSKKEGLTMNLLPTTIMELGNPAFVGKRQQHLVASTSIELNFNAESSNEQAGLTIFQSDFHFYFLAKSIVDGKNVVQLYKGNNEDKKMDLLAETKLSSNQEKTFLRIDANNDTYAFYFSDKKNNWQLLKDNVDAKLLSTKVAGGFVGSLFGMYATSNGESSANKASFKWLDYKGTQE